MTPNQLLLAVVRSVEESSNRIMRKKLTLQLICSLLAYSAGRRPDKRDHLAGVVSQPSYSIARG